MTVGNNGSWGSVGISVREVGLGTVILNGVGL